ncbi:MAG: copper homeostasis protein CutC [Muribaculaceae bacterium]|nr:copper homeostasis protein CutC [Muribaculaceae bacterium]
MSRGRLEICCGDFSSVVTAIAGGADRVELCSGLDAGGLTPSAGFIEAAVAERGKAAVHVLIRPREGDFLYSAKEIEIMESDIAAARAAGAQGVVIGALNSDGSVDTATCRRLINAAGGLSVTFHRAFDMTSDPARALEEIIALGCDRILTSGCAPTAAEGAEMLRRLNETAAGRIIILGGCGVVPTNAAAIIASTGLTELHASARSSVESLMTFRNSNVAMGAAGSDEFSRKSTDISKVRLLAETLHKI